MLSNLFKSDKTIMFIVVNYAGFALKIFSEFVISGILFVISGKSITQTDLNQTKQENVFTISGSLL